ncbi:hypothetical protein B0I35DRAFT_464788, partial [Stachybotrys elegans]
MLGWSCSRQRMNGVLYFLRRRHVKCDESKPYCQKCIKYAGSCEGYNSKPRAKRLSKSRDATEPPKPALERAPLVFPKKINECVFASQAEQEYFRAWCRGEGLGGGLFLQTLLTTSIAQLGFEEPPVRHAIIALGCMKFALAGNFSSAALTNAKTDSLHYMNALRHYCKSLKLLQQSTPGKRSLWNAMVCCILFIAFEAICNNKTSVIKHIRCGLAMARQYITAAEKPAGELALTSLTSHSMEHEIIHMFHRLDCHAKAMDIFQPCEVGSAAFYTDAMAEQMCQAMPSTFKNADEAHRWLGVMRFLMNSLGIHQAQHPDNTPADNGAFLDESSLFTTQDRCLARLLLWSRSFQPLFDNIRTFNYTNPKEYLRLLYLRIEYLWTYCYVSTAKFRIRGAVYLCTAHFEELVHLIEKVLAFISLTDPYGEGTSSCGEAFAIEEGLVLALFIAAVKCRDHDIQRRAVDLLGKYQTRNGLFDSRECHALAEWNLLLEEKCVSEQLDEDEYWNVMLSRRASFDEIQCKLYAR